MVVIYMDEAGISGSGHETVGVVGALLVHSDESWVSAYQAMVELVKTVPAPYQNGFVPHAKTIWNDRKYREHWPENARLEFIKGLVAIPRRARIPLTVCCYEAATQVGPNLHHMTEAQARHAEGFVYCLAEADGILSFTFQQLATVIAEDVPKIRDRLKRAFQELRARPIDTQKFGSRVVSQIIDSPHFVAKGEAPLLPIVDACVFSLRRWLEGLEYGEEMVSPMFAEGQNLEDLKPPAVKGWRTQTFF